MQIMSLYTGNIKVKLINIFLASGGLERLCDPCLGF